MDPAHALVAVAALKTYCTAYVLLGTSLRVISAATACASVVTGAWRRLARTLSWLVRPTHARFLQPRQTHPQRGK